MQSRPISRLVDVRFLVGVSELDGILNLVRMCSRLASGDIVKHRRDAGGLARAGDSREDDQPFGIVAQRLDAVGQAEVLEAGDEVVDALSDERQVAALLEEADAEAAFVLTDDVRGSPRRPLLREYGGASP